MASGLVAGSALVKTDATSVEGDPPIDEGYIPIGYSEIAQFIQDTLVRREADLTV